MALWRVSAKDLNKPDEQISASGSAAPSRRARRRRNQATSRYRANMHAKGSLRGDYHFGLPFPMSLASLAKPLWFSCGTICAPTMNFCCQTDAKQRERIVNDTETIQYRCLEIVWIQKKKLLEIKIRNSYFESSTRSSDPFVLISR